MFLANTKKTSDEKIDKEVPTMLKDNESDVLKKQISDMAAQIETLKNALLSVQANTGSVIKTDKFSSIGCRSVNGLPVYSPHGDVDVFIPFGFNNTVKFTENEVRSLLKSNYVREYLQKDILYFVDEPDYDYYEIKKKFDLDDDSLTKLVKGNTSTMINKFNEYTSRKRDDAVVHSLFFRIAELLKDNKLNDLPYQNRQEIEKYFNFSLDYAQTMLDAMSKLKV